MSSQGVCSVKDGSHGGCGFRVWRWKLWLLWWAVKSKGFVGVVVMVEHGGDMAARGEEVDARGSVVEVRKVPRV